jgi:Protein kinase domain
MTTGWLKADVWSLGCTVVEMVTGNLPYSYYDNPMTAMYHIASGEVPSFRDLPVSAALKAFVIACCAADPTARPTAQELMKFDFVAPFTERYRNTVTPDAVQLQNSDINQCVTDLSAPTVKEGMVLSIDLFTSLDDSSGSTHDSRSVRTKDHKLYTTQNVEQPFQMSGTSSGSVSPRRKPSITDDCTDTDSDACTQRQTRKRHDASTPLTTARKGLFANDQVAARARTKPVAKHSSSHPTSTHTVSNQIIGKTPARNDSQAGNTLIAGSTLASIKEPSSNSSRTVQTTWKDKAPPTLTRVKSSHSNLSESPVSSGKHLPRTFSGVFPKGVSTTASTPSNSVRRAPNHNGPLVIKGPQLDTKEFKEDGRGLSAAVHTAGALRTIHNFDSAAVASSVPYLHASISSSLSADTEISVELDETQNLESYSQDIILNESDVMKHVEKATMRESSSTEIDESSMLTGNSCENIVEDGMKFLSRRNSRGVMISQSGRPPPAQSPRSPSVHSLATISPHAVGRKSIDLTVDRGLRRANSMSQDELRLQDSSPGHGSRKISRTKSLTYNDPGTPMASIDFGQDVPRRSRSNSDVTVPVDDSYLPPKIAGVHGRKDIIVPSGANSGHRHSIPMIRDAKELGDPRSTDGLGPLGLFDNVSNPLPGNKYSVIGLEKLNGTGYSASSSSTSCSGSSGHSSSGHRSESGSDKLERIAQSGPASVRACALRECEILASQKEQLMKEKQQQGSSSWGGVGGSQTSSTSNRKGTYKKKNYHLNFDGINDALKTFSSNIQSSTGPEFSNNVGCRSQSAGMINTAYGPGSGSGVIAEIAPQVDNQLKPLGFLGAFGSGLGASAVHNSNISPAISGLYPRSLGVNLSQHLLPAMNMILPLQRRVIQSAPSISVSRSTGKILPPLQSGGTPPQITVIARPHPDSLSKEVIHLYDKMNRDLKVIECTAEDTVGRKTNVGKFPRRLHTKSKSSPHFTNLDEGSITNEYQT